MTLDEVANKHGADKGSAGHDFMKRYAPFLEPLRDKPLNLLECGIEFGKSARMWLEAFPLAQIYGVDIKNEHGIQDDSFHFCIGDQRNADFWEQWKNESPMITVAVDDSCHYASASKVMFEAIWPHLTAGGLYAIEDTCVWDDSEYISDVDGYDWIRNLIRDVNWNGKEYGGKPHPLPSFTLSEFEQTVDSIHCSKHLVLIQKKL